MAGRKRIEERGDEGQRHERGRETGNRWKRKNET